MWCLGRTHENSNLFDIIKRLDNALRAEAAERRANLDRLMAEQRARDAAEEAARLKKEKEARKQKMLEEERRKAEAEALREEAAAAAFEEWITNQRRCMAAEDKLGRAIRQQEAKEEMFDKGKKVAKGYVKELTRRRQQIAEEEKQKGESLARAELRDAPALLEVFHPGLGAMQELQSGFLWPFWRWRTPDRVVPARGNPPRLNLRRTRFALLQKR